MILFSECLQLLLLAIPSTSFLTFYVQISFKIKKLLFQWCSQHNHQWQLSYTLHGPSSVLKKTSDHYTWSHLLHIAWPSWQPVRNRRYLCLHLYLSLYRSSTEGTTFPNRSQWRKCLRQSKSDFMSSLLYYIIQFTSACIFTKHPYYLPFEKKNFKKPKKNWNTDLAIPTLNDFYYMINSS